MFDDDRLNGLYPTLGTHSDPVKVAERAIVGRENEVRQLLSSMSRPELCNALLLGPAGSGKTALVQATMLEDSQRVYVEVDVSRMIASVDTPEQFPGLLKSFFDEAERYAVDEHHQLVLFMDEFHQIMQLSPAAVEALKPILAASGTRGLRIIAATTYDEFKTHIAPNQPLVERLQRINLTPTDKATTISILRGMAVRYEVADEFFDDHVFELIYDYTQRFVPASSQPRKSILVLDSMVGWHRFTHRAMDRDLLADVLMESVGVNIAFRLDAVRIKEQLDSKVFAQDYATRSVSERLQLCVADLHNKARPLSSFLLSGSSGVGKGTLENEQIPVFTEDGSVAWREAGDLIPGDFVFDAEGKPEKVLGVFPQRKQDVYRVTLSDGRSLVTDGPHLWGVYPFKKDRQRGLTVLSTETLMKRLAEGDSLRARYSIPMNKAVQWPYADLSVHPYALGALIADGALTPVVKPLTISSEDEFVVAKVAEFVGAVGYDRKRVTRTRDNGALRVDYTWVFASGGTARNGVARVQKKDIIGHLPEVMDRYSKERRIPPAYLTASVDQRWALVQGLFDSDGHIGGKDNGRFNVSYSTSSAGLAEDVRHLLYSLGVGASVRFSDRPYGEGLVSREYTVRVRSLNQEKHRFFTLPRKLEIAARAAEVFRERTREFDYVDIVSVEKLADQQKTVCLYVDHPDHLYQAGRDFIVTHNTELTKQLARLLFGDDQRRLVRFDMSEYAEDSSLSAFRSELTAKVWSLGHAVVLFDEIEKASGMVTRLLLQVLDDARLSDDNGREVSFLNCYIVLTTNAGSEVYKSMGRWESDNDGKGDHFAEYMKLIRTSIIETSSKGKFPPELLGRIDAIVPFQPLSEETRKNIVTTKLRGLVQEVLTKHNVTLVVAPKVLQYLVEDKGDSETDAGGARAAISLMTTEVTTRVAAFLNANPTERRLRVDVTGELASDHKTMLKSNSVVEVTAMRG